ncbi:hypothetical protein ACFV4G_32425 [Kitasatospora sp. NPDC059747]|uniref:hypothetical protein n=1 Tax=Kitasatospora sp. NPDC059747 TaxID=3346930 RepID=UPI00364FFD03
MTETHTWSYDGTELAWLQAALERPGQRAGHVVGELVPGGFGAYLRVFHRFDASDGSGRTRSWRERAEAAGRPFHAEMSHGPLLQDADGPDADVRWLADSGQPDVGTRRALARCLGRVTGEQPVLFAYDLAALLWGAPGPLVRRSSLAGLDSSRPFVAAEVGLDADYEEITGPEFWWPEDRSWVVTSDYDLLSTYVGCSAEAAALILADDGIEALPVTPGTRVDFAADDANSR